LFYSPRKAKCKAAFERRRLQRRFFANYRLLFSENKYNIEKNLKRNIEKDFDKKPQTG
jgi:hypothetical protein